MSDANRQSFTDKMGATMKPDSQKSSVEKAGDYVKEKMDSVASTMQPDSEKSHTQKIGDAMSGNSNENQESLVDKAKNAMGMGGNKNSTQ